MDEPWTNLGRGMDEPKTESNQKPIDFKIEMHGRIKVTKN
jgi:hypothetical protein